MPLKGNLKDISITQVLNLVHVAQKTGTLTVERQNEKAYTAFLGGKLAFAQYGQEDSSLPAILYRAKKITASQYRVIQEKARSVSDKELGLLMVNANYISQQDILASLQMHCIAVINRLFTWAEGIFQFENDILPPDGKIPVRVNLENIIIEGTRRMKELEQLQDEIPSLDIALKFANRPGTNIKDKKLNVDEWKVISYISPRNSIKQIAAATKLSDLEIRRVVYTLLQAGLVELIRPEGAAIPVPIRPAIPNATHEEQTGLIHRLINRIRSI